MNSIVKAVINKDTPQEISWKIDEFITPELIAAIKKAGVEKNISWKESPLYDLVHILLDTFSYDDLEERMYDEDPEIIDLIEMELDTFNFSPEMVDGTDELARLYLPVMIVILEVIGRDR